MSMVTFRKPKVDYRAAVTLTVTHNNNRLVADNWDGFFGALSAWGTGSASVDNYGGELVIRFGGRAKVNRVNRDVATRVEAALNACGVGVFPAPGWFPSPKKGDWKALVHVESIQVNYPELEQGQGFRVL